MKTRIVTLLAWPVATIIGLIAFYVPAYALHTPAAAPLCGGRHIVAFAGTVDAATQGRVATIACATMRVRGLTPRSPVTVRVVDGAGLRAVVAQITQDDLATQPLTGTTMALQLLGAIAPKADMAAIKRSQYNGGTAAQYDVRSKVLYIRTTSKQYAPLDRAVIAHEYTRALQDQNFGLAGMLSNGGDAAGHNSDAQLARQALVEGDAVTTMLSYATANFSRQDLLLLNQQLQRPGNPEMDFPHDLLGFPTAQGTAFVKYIMQAAAHGKHGSAAQNAGNAAVSQALQNPPGSTGEVLNPASYLQRAHKGASSAAAPTVDLGSDWTEVDTDVLGAFGIGDLLGRHAQTAAAAQAATAAKQWQSDRWVVYQRGGDTLIIWRAHFATNDGAQAFMRALVAYTGARFHTSLSAQTSLDWHTTGYAMSCRQQNGEVAVSIGSSKDLQDLVKTAVTRLGFA